MPTKEPRLIVKVERLIKKKCKILYKANHPLTSSPLPRYTHTRFLRPLPSLYFLAHIF